jgi:hypothetical protein
MKKEHKGDVEKRSGKRFDKMAPVRISYLHNSDRWDASMLNYSVSGMCFKSKTPFRHCVGLLIRLDGSAWADTSPSACKGLHYMTLGEVKWCKKLDDEPGQFFMTGVKYFPSPY